MVQPDPDPDPDPDPNPDPDPDPDPDSEVPYRAVRVLCWDNFVWRPVVQWPGVWRLTLFR